MREMTIKDIQSISLQLLKEVHRFCTERGITYSITAGTLIGAVRHRGFIPWDDDIDILMPRKDYDRFCAEYPDSSKYCLFAPCRHNTWIPFARLCEMEQTLVKSYSPCFKKKAGMWVDIFPIDRADEDFDAYWAKNEEVYRLKKLLDKKRLAVKPLFSNPTWKDILKSLIYFKPRTMFVSGQRLLEKMENISRAAAPDGNYVTNYHTTYRVKDHYPKEDFAYTVDLEFEGQKFKALNGYEDLLKRLFGDYMQLPPEEKRHAKHNMHHYYWKD